MTEEEIYNLAKSYAESVCPTEGYSDMDVRNDDITVKYGFALPVLAWLNRDYCIVSKEEVLKMKKYAETLRHRGDYRRFDADIIDETLYDLFTEELFQ